MQCTLFCTQGACILIRANHYHRLSRWFVFRPIRTLFLCWSLKTHRKVRQPQHQLLAKLPGLITFSCFWLIKWLANLFYYIIGGFLHNAEAIPTTRRAGGLFVLQSFVFRISEKLLNGEQGLALTMQNGRKVQNSPTILFLSQLLYNVNLMTLQPRRPFFMHFLFHILT